MAPTEAYGFLREHYAIRRLMHSVATDSRKGPGPVVVQQIPPSRSANHSQLPGFSPRPLTDVSRTVTDEIVTEFLAASSHRARPRVVT